MSQTAAQALTEALRDIAPEGRVIFFPEIDSTNRAARELAAQGVPSGTLVAADYQTQGRGRLDRVWQSPPGANLMFSLVLRPNLEVGRAFNLTMAAAVSMARAVKKVTGLQPLLKWPNDLFLDGKKLAGVLTELKASKGKIDWAVIGVGLNTSAHPPDVEAVDLAGELGRPVDRFAILRGFVGEMNLRVEMDPERLRQEWTELSWTLGRKVVVQDNGDRLSGLARGIDEQGALLLESGGRVRKVVCGDLVVEG